MFIDSHAHLYCLDYQNAIERAKNALVDFIVCPSTNEESIKQSVEIASKFPNVFACVGFHPEDIKQFGRKEEELLINFAKHKKVLAIGEIGLDYHFGGENKQLQKYAFERQIEIANSLSLPIVVHIRDAMDDALKILTQQKNHIRSGGVVHCFGGDVQQAKKIMKLGLDFTFGGICTFKKSEQTREVIKFLPLENILLETDSPYLSPEPVRGSENEPKNIVFIAEKIAEIKNESVQKVALQTSMNAKRIFKI